MLDTRGPEGPRDTTMPAFRGLVVSMQSVLEEMVGTDMSDTWTKEKPQLAEKVWSCEFLNWPSDRKSNFD